MGVFDACGSGDCVAEGAEDEEDGDQEGDGAPGGLGEMVDVVLGGVGQGIDHPCRVEGHHGLKERLESEVGV